MRTRIIALVSLLAAALPASAMLPPSQQGGKVFHAFKSSKTKTKAKTPAPKQTPPKEAFHLALWNLDHRDYDAAIVNFTKAIRKRPAADRYFLRGYAYYQRGFKSGAPETADKMDAVQVVNDYKEALALDPQLKEIQKPYLLYHGLGMSYEALGLDEKAIDAYRNAFMKAPSDLALPLYGARLRMKMGATRKSLANLTTALKLAQSGGQQAQVAAFLNANPMFSDLLKSPAHEQIVAQYSAPAAMPAARPAPPAMEPAVRMGDLLAMEPVAPRGDAYGLRDSVKNTAPAKTAPHDSRDEEVLQAIASGNDEFKFRHWSKAVDRYDWALAVSRHTGTLGPGETAFVEERIGSAYNKLGQTTQAVTALMHSVQVMPYNSAAHYQLALAYSLSGHYGEAIKSLQESFRTAPSPSELRKMVLLAKTDSELEPLRDRPEYKTALKQYAAPTGSAKR